MSINRVNNSVGRKYAVELCCHLSSEALSHVSPFSFRSRNIKLLLLKNIYCWIFVDLFRFATILGGSSIVFVQTRYCASCLIDFFVCMVLINLPDVKTKGSLIQDGSVLRNTMVGRCHPRAIYSSDNKGSVDFTDYFLCRSFSSTVSARYINN